MAEERIDNLPESEIFEVSLMGLSKQLQRFFPGKTLDVAVVASQTAMRTLARKRAGSIKFPFFTVRFSDLSKNTEGYNASILARRGRMGPRINSDVGNSVETMFHLIPTKVNVTVNMLSNDLKDIVRLSQRWMFGAIKNYLDYQIDVDGEAPINIHVEMAEQFTFPDMESEEIGELFNAETTLVLNTYLGYIRKRTVIVDGKVNLDTIITPDTGPIRTSAGIRQTNFTGT